MTNGTRRGGERSASHPGRFLPPGKTRYPLYRRLGGPHCRSGQARKISPQPGFDSRTVQPVASRYTEYAARPTLQSVTISNCGVATILQKRQAVWSSRLSPLAHEFKSRKGNLCEWRVGNLCEWRVGNLCEWRVGSKGNGDWTCVWQTQTAWSHRLDKYNKYKYRHFYRITNKKL